MELILFIIIVSLLFPGSGGGGHFEPIMIVVFLVCAAMVIGFFASITYAAVGIAWLFNSDMAGMIAWPVLFFAALFANKYFWEWRDRAAVNR